MNTIRTLALLIVVANVGSLTAAPIPKDADAKALEKWYSHLAMHDTNSTFHGLLPMLRHPAKDVVAFLETKLQPLELSETRARQLLFELGSNDEKMARKAFIELGTFDIRLAMTVQKAFEILPQGVARQRLAAILDREQMDEYAWCKLDYTPATVIGDDGKQSIEVLLSVENMANKPIDFKSHCDRWNHGRRGSHSLPNSVSELDPDQWKCLTRSIAILEHLGTPQAKKRIEAMADGHRDAKPTVAARNALQRLAKPSLKPNFQKIWIAFLKDDEEAFVGVLAMLKHRTDAFAAIQASLQPIQPTEAECRKLLEALGKDDEKIWRAAWDQLHYLDPRLTFELPKLMAEVPDGLARTRVVELLTGTKADSMRGSTIEIALRDDGYYTYKSGKWNGTFQHECKHLRPPAWQRVVTAIWLLEAFETPEATKRLSENFSWENRGFLSEHSG